MNHCVVVFDGTSYFVEDSNFIPNVDEEIVYRGSFENCNNKADELNDTI